MRQTRVWARGLGLCGAVVEGVELELPTNTLVVWVRVGWRDRDRCGICRRRCPGFDLGRGRRRFGQPFGLPTSPPPPLLRGRLRPGRPRGPPVPSRSQLNTRGTTPSHPRSLCSGIGGRFQPEQPVVFTGMRRCWTKAPCGTGS